MLDSMTLVNDGKEMYRNTLVSPHLGGIKRLVSNFILSLRFLQYILC